MERHDSKIAFNPSPEIRLHSARSSPLPEFLPSNLPTLGHNSCDKATSRLVFSSELCKIQSAPASVPILIRTRLNQPHKAPPVKYSRLDVSPLKGHV